MPRYRFKARTLEGRPVDAVRDAGSEEQLEAQLAAEGLVLISAQLLSRARVGGTPVLSGRELIFFTMELGTSYEAGLPLLQTLEDMSIGAETKAVRTVCQGLAERVSGGASLAEALAAYPRAFPPLFVELVASAERTGKLDAVLKDLVRFLEWQQETRSQIVGATIYPASMIAAVVGLMLVLTLFVFPRFLSSFSAMGGDLPLPTRILLGIDRTVGAHKGALFLLALVFVGVFMVVRRLPVMRWRIDWLKLKLPITGPLLVKLTMSLFTHNLAMMIGAGLDFSTALRMCERIVSNAVFAQIVADARVAVESGQPLSEAMSRGNLVPSLVRRMLKLGENTGRMEESLENVSRYYDKDIPKAIKRMFAILEPTILVVMAVVVLFMASAVLLPIYGMITKIGGD